MTGVIAECIMSYGLHIVIHIMLHLICRGGYCFFDVLSDGVNHFRDTTRCKDCISLHCGSFVWILLCLIRPHTTTRCSPPHAPYERHWGTVFARNKVTSSELNLVFLHSAGGVCLSTIAIMWSGSNVYDIKVNVVNRWNIHQPGNIYISGL